MAAFDDSTQPLTAVPKISRYRSQRKAQQQQQPDVASPTSPRDSPQEDGVTRSKSRYHRKNTLENRPATARDQDVIDVPHRSRTQKASPPAREAKPTVPQNTDTGREETRPRTRSGDDAGHLSPPARAAVPDLRRLRSADGGIEKVTEKPSRPNLTGQRSFQRSADALPAVAKINSAPTGELFSPPRPEPVKAARAVLIDGPPTSDQIRATRTTMYLPNYTHDEETAGCFGFFKRKRSGGSPLPAEEKGGLNKETPIVSEAPISAVNAGDRRVLVQCGKTKTIFPVTPTTTSVDIIKSAETILSENINLKSAVLLEYFSTVGVQRPLRRYEHIRDVMNSWDTDRQNSLVLVDPGVGSSEIELSIAGVPAIKPEEVSWFMSYSQKPGKWDKRLVTIKADGQITVLKDHNKPQTAENACHLSDFDIYTPTQEKLRKKIKPPKKHCFAVKSQQKTSMFESTDNFVHFFSTGDRNIADDFYRAVQSWRSWYLVHVMGEGKKTVRARSSTDFQRGHRAEESFSSHYQLGSFQPLVDFGTTNGQQSNSRPTSRHFESGGAIERRTSTRRKDGPPVTIHNRAQLADDEPLGNLGRKNSVRASGDYTNAGGLSRSYSQRQNGDHGRGESADIRRNNSTRTRPRGRTNDLPPTTLSRSRSTRSQTRPSLEITRTNSRSKANGPTRPLIDLTPQYREPPQHLKKGRGHNPDNVGPGGLVDAATSPDDVLGVPSSVDWRGNNVPQQHFFSTSQQSTESRTRAYSASRHGGRPGGPSTTVSPTSVNSNGSGFTGEGLLAGAAAKQGWGGEARGRGYMDGSHARGPMLDLREQSRFAGGSLLERVERQQGGPGPQAVLDREKRVERDVRVGEGY